MPVFEAASEILTVGNAMHVYENDKAAKHDLRIDHQRGSHAQERPHCPAKHRQDEIIILIRHGLQYRRKTSRNRIRPKLSSTSAPAPLASQYHHVR